LQKDKKKKAKNIKIDSTRPEVRMIFQQLCNRTFYLIRSSIWSIHTKQIVVRYR